MPAPSHVNDLPHRTQEYLKVIYDLLEWGSVDGTDPAQAPGVSLSHIAEKLGQRASTTSEGIKRLAAAGLVHHQPYAPITLTEEGHRLALTMVRRHRLIETFLHRHLGYDLASVHDEADNLEHAVSDTFIDRISAVLGHPDRDPHGDPIPTAAGVVDASPVCTLTTCPPGATVMVDRISDRDPKLLKHLTDYCITPGVWLYVAPRPFPGMAEVAVLGEEPQSASENQGNDPDNAELLSLPVSALDSILCRVGEGA